LFLLVLFVPASKFTLLEGTPVREYPTSTRSKCAVLLVLVSVSCLLLVLFVPASKFTLLEGTPVREYPTSTRSTGAVLLVPVLFALGWLTGSLAGFMARP
jgi:hypothetical protein